MRNVLRKLQWLVERRRKEAELREELEFHLEEEREEQRAEGLRTTRPGPRRTATSAASRSSPRTRRRLGAGHGWSRSGTTCAMQRECWREVRGSRPSPY